MEVGQSITAGPRFQPFTRCASSIAVEPKRSCRRRPVSGARRLPDDAAGEEGHGDKGHGGKGTMNREMCKLALHFSVPPARGDDGTEPTIGFGITVTVY